MEFECYRICEENRIEQLKQQIEELFYIMNAKIRKGAIGLTIGRKIQILSEEKNFLVMRQTQDIICKKVVINCQKKPLKNHYKQKRKNRNTSISQSWGLKLRLLLSENQYSKLINVEMKHSLCN
jgi:hypothetical protein